MRRDAVRGRHVAAAAPRRGGVSLARPVLERAAFPLLLLGLVAGFLVVQGRVDRRDPKLALARVHGDMDLSFPSPDALP